MIIDLRVRPPYGGYLGTHMYRDRVRTARMARAQGQEPPGALAEASWTTFLEELDASGIDRAVVPGRRTGRSFGDVPNADIAAMASLTDGRLIGLVAVEEGAPSAEAELVHGVHDLGLAGLALDPGMADHPRYLDDPALLPLYDRCAEMDVPVMITFSGNAGPDVGYADAVRLDRLAARHPDLQVVVAHGGWPWVLPTLGVAFRRPNVWISPDMYLVGMPGALDYVEAANGFLRDRLLFGSSYPFTPLAGALEAYRSLPFDRAVLPLVLGENAARLLRL